MSPSQEALGIGGEATGRGVSSTIEFPVPLQCGHIFVHKSYIKMMLLLGWLRNNLVSTYQAVSVRKEFSDWTCQFLPPCK